MIFTEQYQLKFLSLDCSAVFDCIRPSLALLVHFTKTTSPCIRALKIFIHLFNIHLFYLRFLPNNFKLLKLVNQLLLSIKVPIEALWFTSFWYLWLHHNESWISTIYTNAQRGWFGLRGSQRLFTTLKFVAAEGLAISKIFFGGFKTLLIIAKQQRGSWWCCICM